MSAATADPETLTVVKLKESLRATGVSFPSNALKADLVKLYRANIGGATPSAPATPAALTTNASVTRRPRSPARGRKSPAREAPAPTPSTPKAHAVSHTTHTSPPGSGGGGLRIISTQPLRPTGAAPAPAAAIEARSNPSPPAPASVVPHRQPTPPLPSPLPSPILPVASQNLAVEPVQRPPSPPPPAAPAAAPAPAARHEEPEAPNYSPVLFWAIVAAEVLLTLLALHFGFALLTALVTPHKFCDTNTPVVAGCIACPEHGVCTNGQLACDVGYVQQGKSCIEDSRIAKQAYKAGAALRAHLQQQSGRAECNNLPLPVSITSEEAKAITQRTLGDKTPGDGDVFSLVYERVKAKAQELDLMFDLAADQWTTTAAPIRPFSCEFKAFVRHLLVLWVYVWLAREKRNHDLVQATFIEVLSILAENPSFPFAVSHIRDQVARTGTPQARLWRRVEEAVESDSRVGKEQQMVQHIQTTTWRWVAGPLSPRRQSFT